MNKMIEGVLNLTGSARKISMGESIFSKSGIAWLTKYEIQQRRFHKHRFKTILHGKFSELIYLNFPALESF